MHFLLKSTLLFVLLYMQYGTMVHAVQHPFHDHDDYDDNVCEAYVTAERLASANFQYTLDLPEMVSFDTDYQMAFWVSIQTQVLRPRSRAPPSAAFS